jgi:hypothetical protein
MANVVLRGLTTPAVKIYDLDLVVSFGQEVTISLDEYVSSSCAQACVDDNLVLLLQGPSVNPRTMYQTDVDPETFNLRQNSVNYNDLTYELQAMFDAILTTVVTVTDPSATLSAPVSILDCGSDSAHNLLIANGGTIKICQSADFNATLLAPGGCNFSDNDAYKVLGIGSVISLSYYGGNTIWINSFQAGVTS